MNIKYPLATTTWDQQEYDAMQEVIASGMFTMGKSVEAFEKNFASAMGSKHSVMSNSGSSANLLMIAALFYKKDSPLKAGDGIIVPAVSWSTTYYPLHQYGLKMRFVDIDLETLNYDMDQLQAAINDDTRAIMVVNLLGNPNDFNAINRLIEGRDIILVEDNCESMGAKLDGKNTGTFGAMGTFSTFFSHHISTMEGGVTVTDDEELYHIMLSLRSHGWTRHLPQQNHVCQKSSNPFDEMFRFVLPGYNLRPLELSGAIGLKQIEKLAMIVSERRKNAALFQAAMKDHPTLMIQKEIGESSWFGFSLVIRPNVELKRADLINRLNELGFECRPIVAGNFARSEVIKYFDCEIVGNLENADHIHENGIFIGNHHYPIASAIQALQEI